MLPGQLSLLCWRLLTGLEVLWLDIFGEDISYGDLRGFYQLKKPAGLSVAYFATWGVHGNLVRSDPLLKKGYRYGWFVAEGEWGRSIPSGNEVVHVRNFFNEDSMRFFPPLSLSMYIYISRMNFLLIHYFLGFLQTSLGPREPTQFMKWGGK